MRYGSLFSGIGGFDLGFDRAGMECVWQVEKNAQCREVLAKHWPQVPRHDDVTTFNATIAVRPELICGGFPCQDLSVAGKRAGLAGERSGLFYEFMRIVSEFAPEWVCIENVPGLLSSNGGRDMGAVLGTLGQLGYGWAYRVLDAQWFGVAQRRRRVFIIGCLGDGRRAAEVLFESDCLPWDSPPSREAGKRVAHCIAAGVGNRFGSGRDGQDDFVTHTLRAEGFDASEDGTGSGTPLVAACLNSGGNSGGFRTEPGEHIVPIIVRDERGRCGDGLTSDMAFPLHAAKGISEQQCVAYSIQERAVSENPNAGPQGKGWNKELGYTLEARHHQQAVAFAQNQRDEVREMEIAGAIAAEPGMKQQTYARTEMGVRRLMPVECERLQGFPDGWTAGMSDSARYRMLGNAVCVNVAEWIAKRLTGG
jgi:DNA (cytosine-5)-methyltransferase 1